MYYCAIVITLADKHREEIFTTVIPLADKHMEEMFYGDHLSRQTQGGNVL